MKTVTLPARAAVPGEPAALPAQIQELLPGISQLPETVLEADTLLVPDQFTLGPIRRLVVLVPTGETNEHVLARRVWQLAASSRLDILYLVLAPDTALYSYQHRRLIGLAALTTSAHGLVDIDVHVKKNWSRTLRQILRPDDLLICLADDRAAGIFRHQALGERLASDLRRPVYKFGDLQVEPEPVFPYRIKSALGWIASMAMLVAFLWLQVGIDRAWAEPQATILVYLSVLAELYIMFKINDWIG